MTQRQIKKLSNNHPKLYVFFFSDQERSNLTREPATQTCVCKDDESYNVVPSVESEATYTNVAFKTHPATPIHHGKNTNTKQTTIAKSNRNTQRMRMPVKTRETHCNNKAEFNVYGEEPSEVCYENTMLKNKSRMGIEAISSSSLTAASHTNCVDISSLAQAYLVDGEHTYTGISETDCSRIDPFIPVTVTKESADECAYEIPIVSLKYN